MPHRRNASRTAAVASIPVLRPGNIFLVYRYVPPDDLASRLAIELGLNRDENIRPLDERHERELLNRRRTWMICSIMDGSTSLETGKDRGVGKDDEVLPCPCRHPPAG